MVGYILIGMGGSLIGSAVVRQDLIRAIIGASLIIIGMAVHKII